MRYSLVEQDLGGPDNQGTAPPAPPPCADERRAPSEPSDLRSAETDAVNRGHDPSIKYPRKPRSLPPPPLSGSGEPGPRTSLSTSTTLQPRDRVRNQRQQNPAPVPGATQCSVSMRNRPKHRCARRAMRTVDQERARMRNRRDKRRSRRRAQRATEPPTALRLAAQCDNVLATRDGRRRRIKYVQSESSVSPISKLLSKNRKLPLRSFNIESAMVTSRARRTCAAP